MTHIYSKQYKKLNFYNPRLKTSPWAINLKNGFKNHYQWVPVQSRGPRVMALISVETYSLYSRLDS